MTNKKVSAIILLLIFLLSISVIPASAQENQDVVYATNNYPETVKIGEAFAGIESFVEPDAYKINVHNLTPNTLVEAWCEMSFNSENFRLNQFSSVSFMSHAGNDNYNTTVDTNGNANIKPLYLSETFFNPGTITMQPYYQYVDSESYELIGDRVYVGDPITIQIEEPVIKTNAPESIEVGDTLQFTSELTNTALTNKDTAYYLDENNYYKGAYDDGYQIIELKDDDTHYHHEPAYQPSVEILEGKELVKQTNQDYTNTLKSSETLSFTGIGTVKLKVKYNQFITCASCQSVYDENGKQTGEYYTYNPEKIITIEVVDNSDAPIENNIKYDVPNDILIDGDTSFPSGTVIKAETLTSGDLYEQAKSALSQTATKFSVIDITAINGGLTVQPDEKVKVTFSIPDGYSDNVSLYYIDNNGAADKITTTFNKESRTLTAELEHFSVYVLADEDTKPVTNNVNSVTNPHTSDVSSLYLLFIAISLSGIVLCIMIKRQASKHNTSKD